MSDNCNTCSSHIDHESRILRLEQNETTLFARTDCSKSFEVRVEEQLKNINNSIENILNKSIEDMQTQIKILANRPLESYNKLKTDTRNIIVAIVGGIACLLIGKFL